MPQRILSILTLMVLLTAAGAAVAQLPEHRVARGTLLSITDDEAVIRTLEDNQQLRVRIVAGTTTLPPQELEQGDLVIIDYNLGPDPDQPPVARTIRMDEPGSGFDSDTEPAGTDTRDTEPATSGSAISDSESATTTSQSAQERESDSRSDELQTADQHSGESASSELPQTAGSWPMVALLGLIALGAGTLVRFLRP